MNDLGGRKYILCMLAMIFSTAALFCKLVNETSYVQLMLGLATIYVTGNVAQKVAGKEVPPEPPKP